MTLKKTLGKILNWNPMISKREGKFNILGDDLYKFNRYIFYCVTVLMVGFLIYILSSYGFDFTPRIYIKCDEPLGCNNPFYTDPNPTTENMNMMEGFSLPQEDKEKCVFEWCNQSRLPLGFEFGERPSRLFNSAGFICFFIFMCGLLLNHFLYNRNSKLLEKIKKIDNEI